MVGSFADRERPKVYAPASAFERLKQALDPAQKQSANSITDRTLDPTLLQFIHCEEMPETPELQASTALYRQGKISPARYVKISVDVDALEMDPLTVPQLEEVQQKARDCALALGNNFQERAFCTLVMALCDANIQLRKENTLDDTKKQAVDSALSAFSSRVASCLPGCIGVTNATIAPQPASLASISPKNLVAARAENLLIAEPEQTLNLSAFANNTSQGMAR